MISNNLLSPLVKVLQRKRVLVMTLGVGQCVDVTDPITECLAMICFGRHKSGVVIPEDTFSDASFIPEGNKDQERKEVTRAQVAFIATIVHTRAQSTHVCCRSSDTADRGRPERLLHGQEGRDGAEGRYTAQHLQGPLQIVA